MEAARIQMFSDMRLFYKKTHKTNDIHSIYCNVGRMTKMFELVVAKRYFVEHGIKDGIMRLVEINEGSTHTTYVFDDKGDRRHKIYENKVKSKSNVAIGIHNIVYAPYNFADNFLMVNSTNDKGEDSELYIAPDGKINLHRRVS